MIIIPAVDVIEGRCVRLCQGDYGRQKTYSSDPVSAALEFEAAGLSHLHLVDLEGAGAREPRNLKILEKIASATKLTIDYGGGMYTRQAVLDAFNAGASFVTCGSMAVKNPEEAARLFADFGEKIIIGADCIGTRIASSAWREESELDVVDFISSWMLKGAAYCISTDISKDGLLSGPGYELYSRILSSCSIKLIASGGIRGKDDLHALAEMGLYGAIVGKAYYEGLISAEELKEAEC